jgi:hypothetical protein
MSERMRKALGKMMNVGAVQGTYHNGKLVFVVYEDNLMDLLSAMSIASDGKMCEEIELIAEWTDDE